MALGFLQASGWFASVPLGDNNTQKKYADDNDPSSSSTPADRQPQQQEQETEHADDTIKLMTTTTQSSSTSRTPVRTNKASFYNRRTNSLISDAPTCIIPPAAAESSSSSPESTSKLLPLQKTQQTTSTLQLQHKNLLAYMYTTPKHLNNAQHYSYQTSNNNKVVQHNASASAVAHRRTQSNEERLAMFAELAATNKGDGRLEESCFYYEEMLKIQRYSCAVHQDHDAHALEVAKTLTQLGDSLRQLCTTSSNHYSDATHCDDTNSTMRWKQQRSRSRMLREASNAMKEALSLQRRALGQNHLIVAGTLHSIGILACMRRNYDAASLAFGEEIQIRKDMYDCASAILRNNHQGNGKSVDARMRPGDCGSEEETMMDIGVLSVIMGLTMLKRREYGAAYDAFQDALGFYRRAGLSSQHRYVQDVCRFLRQKRLFYTCVERFWETEGTV